MPVEVEMVLRLLLVATLVAVIGFQRVKAGKQAGLRAHALICIGAAFFTAASIYGCSADNIAYSSLTRVRA